MEGGPNQLPASELPPEEIAKMEKSRTISEAELLKGGADYAVNDKGEKSLVLSQDHIKELDNEERSLEHRADMMRNILPAVDDFFQKFENERRSESAKVLINKHLRRKPSSEEEKDFSNIIKKCKENGPKFVQLSSGKVIPSCYCGPCMVSGIEALGRPDLAKKILKYFPRLYLLNLTNN